MSAKSAVSPDDIEMSSITGALKKKLKTLLFSSLALMAATYGVLSMLAPKYMSQAELAIVAKGTPGGFADPKAPQSVDSMAAKVDAAAINTHVRALQSPDLLDKIAEELKLKDRPEFNAALGPVDMADTIMRLIGLGGPRAGESERDRVLNTLRSQLEVYSAKESRFIGVRATSSDPELAAEIANKIADSYRGSLATQGVVEIDDQQKVLQGKIEKLMPEVAAAETEAERYRGEINSFKGGAQNTGLNEQQMSELTGELTKAKASRGEAEARAKSAREMMKLGSADALPDVQKSPLIQNLVQQRVRIERQISELSASLLPGHPRMQQLNGDLGGLKKQLAGEVAKVVDSLEKEAKVAQGREDAIKKSLDDIKTKVTNNAPEEAKLRQLEANAKAKRIELESLQAQIESNRKKLDTRAQPVEAQVISKAQATSVPVFPKKLPLAALVFVASLLFGTAWTVTKALFSGARGGSGPHNRRATDRAGVSRPEPVLSHSQKITEPKSGLAAMAVASTETETTIASLARRLAAAKPATGGHRTLISGETLAIDAGAEAVEVCKALSDGGAHVVLVDWSPSGRSAAGLGGLGEGRGLTELILGEAGFEEVVKKVPGTSVHVIGCGTSLDEAGGDVDPDQLNLVLDALDEAYDHIVVSGAHEDARLLFEAIQGRFDAGVLVSDAKKRASVLDDAALKDPAGTFLGFEVADIDVIRYERNAQPVAAVNQRIQRATRKGGGDALPA